MLYYTTGHAFSCIDFIYHFRVTPWGSVKEDQADFHSLNKARMTKIWMDPPFNDPLLHYLSDKNFTLDDLASRREIRIKNRCKPYKYFLDQVQLFSNVYFPNNITRYGVIQNELFKHCVDIAKEEGQIKLILYSCHKKAASNQYFILTETNHIRGSGGYVLDVNKQDENVSILLRQSPAVWTAKESTWRYSEHKIEHVSTGMCLTALTPETLDIKPCIGSQSQTWNWGSDEKQ